MVNADGGPADGGATEAAREVFLRQMLAAYELGTLDAAEYTARVRRIEGAGTVADMAAIAARLPGAATAPDPESLPTLDPVDLARLTVPPPKSTERARRSRTTALVAVVVVFAVLVLVGIWLSFRVHSSTGAGGGVVVPPAAVALLIH